MPAPVPSDVKRPSSRLILLFRCGLAVAALAALLLLVADGNGLLRVAAVLAITSVVMIGLSITLRPDAAVEVRQLADEVDELRAELTAVAHLARQSAEPVRPAAGAASVRVDDVPSAPVGASRSGRARVVVPDPGAAGDERPEAADGPERRRGAVVPDPGPASDDPEEYHRPWAGETSGGRRRADDPGDGRSRSAERGTGRRRAPEPDHEEPFPEQRSTDGWYADEEPPARARPASRYASRPAGGVYGGPSRPDGPDAHPGSPPGAEVPPRPVGVVRHTETVHVTTRHTIVDGAAAESGADGGYGRWTAPEERHWSGRAPEPGDRWDGHPPPQEQPRSGYPRRSTRPVPPGRHDDSSWDVPPTTDERPERRTWPRGRHGTGPDEPYGHPVGEAGRTRRAAADHPGPGRAYRSTDGAGGDWSEVRAGGRWAAARDDEHGRELRMGEHRAAVHADSGGTELRVEDHWAAVRRPRRGHPDDGYDRDRTDRGGPTEYPRGGHRADPEWTERALPPGGVPVPEQWRPTRYDHPSWEHGDRADGRPERRY